MNKDFENWFRNKEKLNQENQPPFYHEREIWWCALGVNVGSEMDGTGKNFDRPAIIKGFSRYTCLVVPLTASDKRHKLRPSVGLIDGREAKALLSQLRIIDSRRLIRKIGYLDERIFEDIRKTAKDLL